MKNRSVTIWVVAMVILLLGSVSNTFAAFDLIVPLKFDLNTTGTDGWGTNAWGWLVSTTETLSQSDLENVIFSATISDVSQYGQYFINESDFAPLASGEVAGNRVATFNGTAFDQLLNTGETLKVSGLGFYGFGVNYQRDLVSTAQLDVTVTIGSEFATYSTNINFGDYETKVIEGQRVSSVPEPCSLVLLSLGGLALMRKRRANQANS